MTLILGNGLQELSEGGEGGGVLVNLFLPILSLSLSLPLPPSSITCSPWRIYQPSERGASCLPVETVVVVTAH